MTGPHFLSNIFQPASFTTAEQAGIIPCYKRVEFSKQEYLLKEGSVNNCYWFIEQGFARSFVIDPQGNDITTGFFSIGGIVIEWSSFFLRAPTRENIQALTDCICWELGFEAFQQLFHSIRAFREQGRTTLAGSYFRLKTHSISLIADTAKDRYLTLLREQPHILQNVSLKHIATYLGITDTSLSRIRKEVAGE